MKVLVVSVVILTMLTLSTEAQSQFEYIRTSQANHSTGDARKI